MLPIKYLITRIQSGHPKRSIFIYRLAVVTVNRRSAAGPAVPAKGFYCEEMIECIKGHALSVKLI
jgi:hypothetical protein